MTDIYLVITQYLLDNLQLYHDTMFKTTHQVNMRSLLSKYLVSTR